MFMMPLVTIAIPAYKTEFLAEAIGSALAQTYANVEVLVVDDCSPQNVKAVVDTFRDERLTYSRNERNLGAADPSRNWQRCLELAHGEFLCILCDDDRYEPTYVQTLVSLSQKYPACAAFRCGVKEIDGSGQAVGYYSLASEHEDVEEYLWHYYSRNNHQTVSEWMLRVSELRAAGGYVACPMAWGSDCATIFRLAESGGVVTSPRRLASFRYSDINITGRKFCFIAPKVLGWQSQCDEAVRILENSSHPDREMIMAVIRRERRYELRKLFKHAPASELCRMVANRRYGLTVPRFVLMMLRNPLWHIIARRKKR